MIAGVVMKLRRERAIISERKMKRIRNRAWEPLSGPLPSPEARKKNPPKKRGRKIMRAAKE